MQGSSSSYSRHGERSPVREYHYSRYSPPDKARYSPPADYSSVGGGSSSPGDYRRTRSYAFTPSTASYRYENKKQNTYFSTAINSDFTAINRSIVDKYKVQVSAAIQQRQVVI
jgi:hypothetical protein